jgi:YD repeat-containing protein
MFILRPLFLSGSISKCVSSKDRFSKRMASECAALRSIQGIIRLVCIIGLLLLALGTAEAQTTSPTDGSTPLGLSPGAPAGSYTLTDFDNINLYNGNLNFALPLLGVGGRGAAQTTMMLSIEQHWVIKTPKPLPNCELTGTCDLRYPWPNWWSGYIGNYGPGLLKGRQPGVTCGQLALTRMTFTAPGGTEFELRDQLHNGQPLGFSCNPPQGAARGTVFVTADGTAATFISDSPIYDWTASFSTSFSPSGYLLLRDGTRYRIDNGLVTWMRDRNGNKLSFTYSGPKVTSITDSLNRQVTIAYSVSDIAPYGTCDQISFKGFGGGVTRIIRVSKDTLANALRTTRPGDLTTPQTFQQLFPDLPGSPGSQFNPTVASSLWLPDGRRYRFYYNVYGELARVELPTGGALEYDFDFQGSPYDSLQRRVVERRIYPDGVTLAGKTTYGMASPVTVDNLDASGVLLARSKHYFYPGSGTYQGPTSYPRWQEGHEYKTEVFASDGVTVLRRIENTWQQRALVSWWTGSSTSAPPNDPRISDTTTTLEPGGANLVSRQTFSYDDSVPYNNRSDAYEYGFGVGAGGALVRRTHTNYVTTSSYVDASTGAHIRSLPTQTSAYDAGGIERARATFEYDNYAIDTNHAALVPRTSISGLDSAFTTSYTTRANATATTRYLLVNGSVTGSISAYAQYDIAGNTVKTIDARSNATTIDFSDCFGTPDGNARLNAGSTELNSVGQYSYALPSLVTRAGQTAYMQFDYYLGRPVDAEDANGVTYSGYSDSEPLDRTTKVIRAANQGAPLKSQTTFSYDDTNRIITTTSDFATFGDGALVSKALYDGLGRTFEARTYEGGSNYIAAQTQFDALGRAYKSSNPFRPWQSESAIWTTTAFDALSRVTSVTTPDNAVVTSSYSGNTVTVTDQAGKSRKTVSDALGRLTSVYEDPSSLNYQTSYSYDVLDDLLAVSQGQPDAHICL